MKKTLQTKPLFSSIPSVHNILNLPEVKKMISDYGKDLITDAAREVQEEIRYSLTKKPKTIYTKIEYNDFFLLLKKKVDSLTELTLRPVLNLTGTVLHTNLGRATLPDEAIKAMVEVASCASNLEFNLTSGKRDDRDKHIEKQLCRLTGAEAVTIVNNNAAAVLLILNSLARRKEVLISRGELIEIGGSFRLPEIMSSAGCKLREVGTTNRTYLRDFEEAFGSRTGLILKAHKSNFVLQGFTNEVDEKDLVKFAQKANIPLIVDLGSGSFIDIDNLNLSQEPKPSENISNSVDLVTFSGDKLLGGPQCGVIAGRKDLINKIKKNPLKRVMRCDKITIAAFSALLRLYENPRKAINDIPTLRLLNRQKKEIHSSAERLQPIVADNLSEVATVEIISCKSQVGSGSLPFELLPSAGLKIRPKKISKLRPNTMLNRISAALRKLPVPIISRINDGAIIFDFRCLENEDLFSKQFQFLNKKEWCNF